MQRSIIGGLLTLASALVLLATVIIARQPLLAQTQPPAVDGQVQTQAVGTSFSYQGTLKVGGSLAAGVYDFEFRLFDTATSGTQVGPTITRNNLAVADGVFSVVLDFGNVFAGQNRYLQVGVRGGGAATSFTTLSPRQAITPAPYAIWADQAATSTGQSGSEVWRLAPYVVADSITGALAHGGFVYGSEGSPGQFISGFAPPTRAKVIDTINTVVLSRTGSYTDTFSLVFEVRTFSGQVMHSVSTVPIDLKTAQLRNWIPVPLSNNAANLVVAPGEYLAVRVTNGGAAVGTLLVFAAFEVRVHDAEP